MSKLWLLTMTQNSEKLIFEMIKNIYPTFNGIVGLVNLPNSDSTLEVLEQNKGDGIILTRKFVKHHGHLMSELLFCGHIKENDWCLYLDSSQSCSDYFIEKLPSIIKEFEEKGIGGIAWDNRIFLFQYNPYMSFKNAVHWYLDGITKPIITLPDKEKYIINRREFDKNKHYLLNPIKYFICYDLGNESEAIYGKFSSELAQEHEYYRREFRSYLKNKLNLNLDTLDDLVAYMKGINEKTIIPDGYFLDYCDREFRMTDLFRHKVLDQDLINDICKNRYNWRLSEYLKTGDKDQLNTSYLGTISIYNRQFGFKDD